MSGNGSTIDSVHIMEIQNELSKNQTLMSKAIAERQIAVQVAATRERLMWFTPMLAGSIVFLYKGYQKTKANVVMYPLIPMTFALAYQLDFAYGNKMERVKDLADNIMKHESHLLAVPELRKDQSLAGKTSKGSFGISLPTSSQSRLLTNNSDSLSTLPRVFASDAHLRMSDISSSEMR